MSGKPQKLTKHREFFAAMAVAAQAIITADPDLPGYSFE